MAPGPRKKNFNRRGGDNVPDAKNVLKETPGTAKVEKRESSPPNLNETSSDDQSKKYNKRTIISNWSKYEEPVNDPHADTLRGRDFQVLSSYSGGSESQLQLQDEKEWDEAINDKSITIDFKDLASAVKSIPFHKRIALPEDIFCDNQLARFITVANNWSMSCKPNAEVSHPTISENKSKELECLDPNLNIIESYELEEVTNISIKPFTLEEKTENIIESLASCLSLKNVEKTNDISMKIENNLPSVPDDLDFLLSLSATPKNLKQEMSQKETNVDDWLNSILDD